MPLQPIPKGATRATVFRAVARLRIDDADSLLAARRKSGAIYLAGYAVECQIKYAYCRRKEEIYLPAELELHNWDLLVNAAGLLPDITKQTEMNKIYSALVEQWGPSLRYRTSDYPDSEAKRLYSEMQQLYLFLRELEP